MHRETGYAAIGDARIAYQVAGAGPVDLVVTPGSFVSFDAASDEPMIRLYFRRLESFTRTIRFDRRGMGASDPVPLDALPHLEAYTDEALAVMGAAGSERAAIMAGYDAGPMAMLLAATHPERVSALVLVNTTARALAAADYEIGIAPEVSRLMIDNVAENWGSESQVPLFVPSRADDPQFVSWFAKGQRMTMSRGQAAAYLQAMMELDVRSLLPSIQVPTLVIHREHLPILPLAQAEYIADRIPQGRLVVVPGSDAPFMWDGADIALDAIEEFIGGLGTLAPAHRVVATVAYSDIVNSTGRAGAMGDRRWHELLDVHDELAASIVSAHRGRVVKTTGDGFLATFDRPSHAIQAADEFNRRVASMGIEVRIGLHTGEIERRGDDIAGLAVHLASRVMDRAAAGEILVSRTVKDLVVGSGFEFSDRGVHELKGFSSPWQLYRLEA